MTPLHVVINLLEDGDDFDAQAYFDDYVALPTKAEKIIYIHIGSERSHGTLFTINGRYVDVEPYYNVIVYVNGHIVEVTTLMRGPSDRYVRIGTGWLENNGYIPDGIPFWDYVNSRRIPVTNFQIVVRAIEDFSPPFDGE